MVVQNGYGNVFGAFYPYDLYQHTFALLISTKNVLILKGME